MSERITGELRGAMATGARLTEADGRILDETIWANRAEFENLCDAIDAVHANLEAENESLRRELDRVLGEQEDRDGWIRLPKDADGEYIHFGDVLDQFGTPMTVFAMSNPDPDQGDCMLELITDGISDGTWVRARKMCHYHAPTVEDVLREFGDWYAHTKGGCDEDGIIAEYAAKLRLAGDADA